MIRVIIILFILGAISCKLFTITIPNYGVIKHAVEMEAATDKFLSNKTFYRDTNYFVKYYSLRKSISGHYFVPINPCDIDLSHNIDRKRRTFLIIGARFSSISDDWILQAGKQLFQYGNVVVVDWVDYSLLEAGLFSQFITPIGLNVAKFLSTHKNLINPKSLTVLGHGDGTHIAGAAGKALHGIIDSIVALDPINPHMDTYYLQNSKASLQISDSQWTKVICTTKMYGTNGLDADETWLINGGEIQPQCKKGLRYQRLICSHVWAIGYFIQSLDKQVEWYDESMTQRFGFWADRISGCFNLRTNPEDL